MNQATQLSQEAFERIMDLLTSAPEFRHEFAKSPVEAVRGAGLKVSHQDLVVLNGLASIEGMRGPSAFDERLVLCSSSGY